MIELLTGDDDFACELYVRDQRAALGSLDLASLNSATLDGAGLDPTAFAAAAHAVPFLAERRLVVVHRLVSELSGGAAREAGRERSRRTAARWEAWTSVLLDVPGWTLVLLVEVAPPEAERRRGALVIPPELGQVIIRREFLIPRGDAFRRWATAAAQATGVRFAPGAFGTLLDAVGENPRRLALEVEKLATFAGESPVSEDDVRMLVPAARDASIFALADAVLERDRTRALRLLHQLLDAGASPQYILTMLERQLRVVLTVLDLNRRRVPLAEARRAAGNLPEFVFRRALGQSRRYTAAQLARRIEILCELDAASKSGAIDEELALDLMVAAARRGRARSAE